MGSGTALMLLMMMTPVASTQPTSISRFEQIEEPTVIYHPESRRFDANDAFVNITDRGENTIRFTLRYHPDHWDGDRATQNRDRQRAELAGLGPHQKTGESFHYAMEWRTCPEFLGTDRFCHIFQLKATDGNNGAPLVTVSLKEGRQDGQVQLWSGASRGSVVVRKFKFTPGEWHRTELVITTARDGSGAVLTSIDGDELQGLSDLPVFRPGASDYRPKWGFYRGTAQTIHEGEDWVEHRNISAIKLSQRPVTMPSTARTSAPAHEQGERSKRPN